MKKLSMMLLALVACFSMATTAFAMEDGAYGVYANTNYWNPDTGVIDDGGTANAALGEGMCRSATDTRALVEKIGDDYFVTIRLLLQSNTKTAKFSKHVGVNQYQTVSYDIMAENGVEDSVDYRFQVADPFAPIKAEMYVTPMGRDVLWYIELDASSMSAETGDFVVSAVASTKSEEVDVEIVEEAEVISDLETEPVEDVSEVEEVLEMEDVEEVVEEIEVAEEIEIAEEVVEIAEVTEEAATDVETNTDHKSVIAIVICVVVAIASILVLRRKKK